MKFVATRPQQVAVRRRRIGSARTLLGLSERAVAAQLHPHTGMVLPSPQRSPEVRRAAPPDTEPGGLSD